METKPGTWKITNIESAILDNEIFSYQDPAESNSIMSMFDSPEVYYKKAKMDEPEPINYEKADVFSLGLILLKIIKGLPDEIIQNMNKS